MAHSLRTASQFSRYLGGQPANVAVYVAKLGGRSAVITKLGSDYFGEYVEDQLQHHGVGTEAVSRTSEAATTNSFVTRTVSVPDFQVNRGADALLAVRQVDEEMISRARIVHTSAFALSRDPQRLAVRRAMRLGHRLGKIVTLDPNYDPRVWPDKVEAWEVLAEVMPYVTIVKPSLEDARRLFDFNMDEETLEETALLRVPRPRRRDRHPHALRRRGHRLGRRQRRARGTAAEGTDRERYGGPRRLLVGAAHGPPRRQGLARGRPLRPRGREPQAAGRGPRGAHDRPREHLRKGWSPPHSG